MKKNMLFKVNEETKLMDFLLTNLTDYNRKKIKSILTNGSVFVNNKVVTKYDYVLKKNSEVLVDSNGGLSFLRKYHIDVIYEDKDIIVIEKPYGILTIEGYDHADITVYKLMNNYVKYSNVRSEVYIVHRLDKDTSGVLIFAKNIRMKNALQDNWNDLVKKREYIAIVEGILTKKEDKIISYLKEVDHYMVYSSNNSEYGLKAITNYKVIKESEHFSMLQVLLETGRRNQIRVHMKSLGYPVIGDKKYGSTQNPIKRLGLHASEINVIHPITKELLIFKSKMPEIFNALF